MEAIGTQPAVANFVVDKDLEIATGAGRRARGNLTAIRLLKQLEAERRTPTREEQATLALYVGWGGLPGVFEPGHKLAPIGAELKELLTDREYEAARASTPNAHYTSVEVARALHQMLTQMGFAGGRILEPSMGAGIFVGTTPRLAAAAYQWTGVELDTITGRIAAMLYPTADVRVQGFEKLQAPDASFDAAIGNVPFGDYQVADPRYDQLKLSIHDYFFAKTLDLVRPGGVIAFITSRFTMDRKDSSFRKHIAARADLIAAIRLPNTAFKGSAGTDVVTDIIILQRREGVTDQWRPWVELDEIQTDDGPVQVNAHFAAFREHMLGRPSLQGSMYGGKSEFTLEPHAHVSLEESLRTVIARLPANAYTAPTIESPASRSRESLPGALERAPDDMQDGVFTIRNGALRQNLGGVLSDPNVPAAQRAKVQALTEIKEAVKALLNAEVADEPDTALEAKRKRVNTLYDRFVKAHGPINKEERKETKRIGKEGQPIVQVRFPNLAAFSADPEFPWVTMIEDYKAETGKATKADLLTRRVMRPRQTPERVDTPSQAVPAVLAERGKIDIERIAQLSGVTPEQAVQALAGSVIFENPATSQWEPADQYLAGDVKAKLAEAQAAAAKDPPRYRANVAALEQAIPEDIPPSQIGAQLGAPWVPTQDVAAFITELLGARPSDVSVAHSPFDSVWSVTVSRHIRDTYEASTQWGTARVNAIDLIDDALNLRQTTVTDPHPTDTGKSVKNVKATLAAQEKQQAIKDRFRAWLWENGDRATRLARLYNDQFNRVRLPQFDGSHIQLHGAATHVKGQPFQLRPHQLNAIWRILTAGNTLLAHVVGSGKTYTTVAAGMEAKRLGLARKPLYVVPNHMLAQFRDEFKGMYPMARLLVATKDDFSGDARREFVGRAAAHDWDAVIMTHRSFESIPMSAEFQSAHLRRELDEVESALRLAKEERGSAGRALVKLIEKAKKRREVKIERLLAQEKKDQFLTFEQMGIDMLFVDEAHYGKNLEFVTKMPGVSAPASERAYDLYLKTQHLHRVNHGRGVVFATGTPIANSLAELYTMQRYLQPELLQQRGVASFDAWAATFAEPVTTFELAPDGSGMRPKTRLARYNNMGELAQMFRLVTDVQTAEDLNLPQPELATGKMQVVSAPATPGLRAFTQALVARAKRVRDKQVDPSEDNFLRITTHGRNAAMDMRLVDPDATDDPKGKVNLAVRNIADIYHRTTPVKGAQLVFSDLSTPGSDPSKTLGGVPGWSVYDAVKAKLVAAGVPAKEIRFMHEADTDEKKARLFADVRAGRVRVLMGSTEKMGAGTNVQDLIVALHHIDAPWRPSDVEQRNGRILRQGNLLYKTGKIPFVDIYAYVTEGSFDAYIWQTLERKAGFIRQALTAGPGVRTVEDEGDITVDFATAKAIASGNPKVLEKAQVDSDLARLERLRAAHQDQVVSVRKELSQMPARIAELEPRVQASAADVKQLTETAGDKFTITIGGKTIKKRPAAGEMLQAALTNVMSASQKDRGAEVDRRLGTFAGLELHAVARAALATQSTELYLMLKGEDMHFLELVGNESAPSIVSLLEHLPDKIRDRLGRWTADLERQRTKLAALKERGIQPFEHTEKLEELRRRQAALAQELQSDAETAEREATQSQEAREAALAQKLKGRAADPSDDPGGMALYGVGDPFTAAWIAVREIQRNAARRKRAERFAPEFASSIPEVEERWRASHSILPPGIRERAREAIEAVKKLTRHFPEIDPSRSPLEASVNELLLEHERAPHWAEAVAHNAIARIVDGLTPKDVDAMTRILVYRDTLKDLDNGLYADGRELPYGNPDRAAVEQDLARYEALVAQRPKVVRAMQDREQFVQALTEEMVEADLLPKDVLKDRRYYHRQVMAYFQAAKQTARVAKQGRGVRHQQLGSQKKRVGGSDFNTDYVQAEFEWVSQALTELKTAETLRLLKQLTDRTRALKAEARAVNEIRLGAHLALAANADPETDGPVMAEQALQPYRERAARAISGVLRAILKGQVQIPGFAGAVDEIAEAYQEWKDEMAARAPDQRTQFPIDHPQWWPLLSAMVDTGSPGSKAAASLFKAVREREEFLARTLGRDYVDPRNPESLATLAPEGYTTWQPEQGNHFFRAQSIDQRALDEVLKGLKSLSGQDVRSVIAMGGAKETWIVPEWLAETLTNFGAQPRVPGPLGLLDRAATRAIGYWKQYRLYAPPQVIRYNINNTSGDFDAAIAYGPGMFRHVPAASRDLFYSIFRRTAPEGMTRAVLDRRMERLTELGVVDAGITAHEIPDINDLPGFRRLGEADPISFMGIIGGYFRYARQLTQYRENILRLAAYEYFLQRLQRGETLYAASNPARVRAEPDIERRAALLARDLIGDYAAVSGFTQFARQRLLPFFSFQEVNFKRYMRLVRNLPLEAGASGRGARLVLVGGARLGLKAAKLAVLANAFVIATNLWNSLFFPDEDDELRRRGRERLHLIIGRNDDGTIRTIRVEGAFAALLEWVQLHDYPEDVRDLVRGTATMRDKLVDAAQAPINKLVQMWEPFTKHIGEQITRRATYPDAFRATPIRDRTEHLARAVALDAIYRRVTGRPSPPGNWLAKLAVYRTDPGEAAYFDTRAKAAKWLAAQGKPHGATDPTERSNALYYWKRAEQWGDREAAARWRATYMELGGTARGMRQSLVMGAPLGGLTRKDRKAFVATLSTEDQAAVEMAERWYLQVYGTDERGRRRRLFRPTFSGAPHEPGRAQPTQAGASGRLHLSPAPP